MRAALGIHKADTKSALETFELLSLKFLTHATLFDSRPASCSP